MKILTTPRMERCIGCHSCSFACARLVHKNLSWDTAGIRIASSGGLSTGFEARTCRGLRPGALCACLPHRRLHAAERRRRHCAEEPLHPLWKMRQACPVDAIYLDTTGDPFVCIHCGRCVPFCPHDCLEMSEVATGEICEKRGAS